MAGARQKTSKVRTSRETKMKETQYSSTATMTIKEIKDELEKIYKERSSWGTAKRLFTKKEVKRRELILLKQQLLYRIEEAIQWGDRYEEIFLLKIYKAINGYLKELNKR